MQASTVLDPHQAGYAIDFEVPRGHRAQQDPAWGGQIANYLLEHANELGVQTIIWGRRIWVSTPNGPRFGDYTGALDHYDHVHVELTPSAASMRLPIYADLARRARLPSAAASPAEPPPLERANESPHGDLEIDFSILRPLIGKPQIPKAVAAGLVLTAAGAAGLAFSR